MPIISFPTQTGDFAYSLAFKKNSTQEDFGFGFGMSGRADPDKERQVEFSGVNGKLYDNEGNFFHGYQSGNMVYISGNIYCNHHNYFVNNLLVNSDCTRRSKAEVGLDMFYYNHLNSGFGLTLTSSEYSSFCPAHSITINASGVCGAVSGSGYFPVYDTAVMSLYQGRDISFYLTGFNDCCEIADLIVDGVSQGKTDYYDFSSIESSHTITGVFNYICTTVVPTTVAPTTVAPTTALPTTPLPTTPLPTTPLPTTCPPCDCDCPDAPVCETVDGGFWSVEIYDSGACILFDGKKYKCVPGGVEVECTACPDVSPSDWQEIICTTIAPTTLTPATTALPTTPLPTTALPTTPLPTTPLPTTPLPTTPLPTTPLPTTPLPTTALPTTALPTTPLPTTPLGTTATPASLCISNASGSGIEASFEKNASGTYIADGTYGGAISYRQQHYTNGTANVDATVGNYWLYWSGSTWVLAESAAGATPVLYQVSSGADATDPTAGIWSENIFGAKLGVAWSAGCPTPPFCLRKEESFFWEAGAVPGGPWLPHTDGGSTVYWNNRPVYSRDSEGGLPVIRYFVWYYEGTDATVNGRWILSSNHFNQDIPLGECEYAITTARRYIDFPEYDDLTTWESITSILADD
jgi:hypothetical protein